jgi:hypothetical protein
MKVTKVTKNYYVVNGEKVYFFEPITISKRAIQRLLDQNAKVIENLCCCACLYYKNCGEDIAAFTPACKKFNPPKKLISTIVKEMDKEYDEKRRNHGALRDLQKKG